MAQDPPADPILIIGAGVAGLILSQGLRLRSIPFRLFERHARSHSGQGHRFRISGDAQAALNSVLSLQLRGLLNQTVPARNHFKPRYVDAISLDFPTPTPAGQESRPIDRTWITSLTSLDIDDAIEYEKEFVSYDLRDNHVQANFSDGSSARGSLLVGADGIKSRVRKQLQPARKLLDLERWIMWGRTPLTESLKKDLPQDLLSWCMCLDHEINVQVVVEPIVWPDSGQQKPKSRLPQTSDYIYWAVCTAPFQYVECLPKTVEQKKHFLEKVGERWHPALKHLLNAASLELSACVPVMSSKPDMELCPTVGTKRITLIGDAAHPMSPMGGSAGDTAIRNAADLAKTIAMEGITAKSVADFEARMKISAKDKIEHSFRGGQKFWRGKEWTEYGEIDL